MRTSCARSAHTADKGPATRSRLADATASKLPIVPRPGWRDRRGPTESWPSIAVRSSARPASSASSIASRRKQRSRLGFVRRYRQTGRLRNAPAPSPIHGAGCPRHRRHSHRTPCVAWLRERPGASCRRVSSWASSCRRNRSPLPGDSAKASRFFPEFIDEQKYRREMSQPLHERLDSSAVVRRICRPREVIGHGT